MTPDPIVDVVLPVLDEAQSVGWALDRMPTGYRPIVVDNGSTDRSAAVAHMRRAIVIEERRRGFGAACFRGLVSAEAELVAFMDCDSSLDPADLPAVVAPVRDGVADLVLGARRPEAGAMSAHVRLANRYLAWQVSRRTGATLTDLGPMRAARRESLLALALTDRRSGWPLEMVLRAGLAGWRIIERPVPYYARAGYSKVTGTASGTLRAIKDMTAALATIPSNRGR
jgi:glycosyltransferase involved in cell wall biosynthesis